MDKLNDVSAVRDQLGGIGRSLAFDLIRTGQLASVKVGRRRMVPQSAIDAYIRRQLQTGRGSGDAA